jgi:hypothetical protein
LPTIFFIFFFQYNFVTELTSMVVVMQNDEKIVPRFAEEKNEDSSNNLQMQMPTWSARPTWSGGPDRPGYFQGHPIGKTNGAEARGAKLGI